MATRYQALIRDAEAYAAFKEMMPTDEALPATYDAWLNKQAEERHTAAGAGNIVRPIDVEPAEFARYCAAAGLERNSVTLGGFAVAKAMGRSY